VVIIELKEFPFKLHSQPKKRFFPGLKIYNMVSLKIEKKRKIKNGNI